MKKIITLILLSINILSHAQGTQFEWARGNQGTEIPNPGMTLLGNRGVAVDAVGNVYTVGEFQGIIDFDSGPGVFNIASTLTTETNIYVMKMDSSGKFLWAKAMQGDRGAAYTVALDSSGNIYMAGEFRGKVDFDPGPGKVELSASTGDSTDAFGTLDLFICKLDNNGNLIWAKKMDIESSTVGGCYAVNMTVDKNGNVYTVGVFSGKVDFDPGTGVFNMISKSTPSYSDVFISKLDAFGNFIWAKKMAGTASCVIMHVAVDAGENVYTTGSFSGTVDFDPGVAEYKLSAKSKDVFISRLNTSGDFVWAKSLSNGSSDQTTSHSIILDAIGNVYVSGVVGGKDSIDFDPGSGTHNILPIGKNDGFILQLNASGNFNWVRMVRGNTSTDAATVGSLSLDKSGNIYATGALAGSVDLDPDTSICILTSHTIDENFTLKLNASGMFVFAKKVAETGYVYSSSSIDASGNLYTAGMFAGTIDFDPGTDVYTLTYVGFISSFVQKMKPCTITYGEVTHEACFSYTLNGQTFTKNGVYKQMLSNLDGCDSILTLHLTIINPSAICMVTVDNASTHNVIVWQKQVSTQIDSFRIYRKEGTVYHQIGSVAYTATPEYHDYTVNPNKQEYFYKMAIVSKCGTVDTMSNFHNTIHAVYTYGRHFLEQICNRKCK